MEIKDQIQSITDQYTQDPITLKIERVAAYVRVSTQEQKLHGISLDAQRAKLQEFADRNNMRIVEWYMDEGVSGRKLIKNRPELQRMIQDAEAGKFDRIIFIKLDRFFRSVAEYHECMKRITPVLWTTTEEQYDLTTANGRMLVNMKLTIAEMEADQTGERINIVNEYKVSTGQPLSGSMQFGFKIAKDDQTGRKKIVRDPEVEHIVRDVIDNYLTHQSRKRALIYMKTKYNVSMSYTSLKKLFENTMLYGAYRDNSSFCEAYIDKETFERMQEIAKRNIKSNTAHKRAYYFSGLIKCPICGCTMKGTTTINKRLSGKKYVYKRYRCSQNKMHGICDFNKTVSENAFERLLVGNISRYLDEAKANSGNASDTETFKLPEYNIEDIYAEIDRLNYSWQTGKIRKVEQYEKQYEDLVFKLDQAEAQQKEFVETDYTKIDAILESGWRDVYESLDDENRRAFWRSFIKSIEIKWTTKTKEIVKVNFF